MALHWSDRGGFLLLRPQQLWDQRTQWEIQERILAAARTGTRRFVIDLRETTHIQFQVLDSLQALSRRVEARGGALAISAPDSYLLEILAAGDIPRAIPVFPSEASAALGIAGAPAASMSVAQEGERGGSGSIA